MPKPASSPLIQLLEQRKQEVSDEFRKRHVFADKWLKERGITLDQIREHSAKLLTSATLGSALLLTAPGLPLIGDVPSFHKSIHTLQNLLEQIKLISQKKLSVDEEEFIIKSIKNLYGISTAFELDHQRLLTYYGKMGLEQHLTRFPNDSLMSHQAFQEVGLAPGLGAFGYFTGHNKPINQVASEEQYYIVLQTFLLPQWNQEWVGLKEWYKFRKFMVINPLNGKAVITVLGDSGPGVSTGKVFGGSPEVMYDLGFYPRFTKGDVFVVFIDDPGNIIPLGPVKGGNNE